MTKGNSGEGSCEPSDPKHCVGRDACSNVADGFTDVLSAIDTCNGIKAWNE